MNTKKRQNIIQEIKDLISSRGYKEDKYGNFQITKSNGDTYRYKFTKIGLRYESKCRHSDGTSSWVRHRSGYIKDIYITEDKRIGGMSF